MGSKIKPHRQRKLPRSYTHGEGSGKRGNNDRRDNRNGNDDYSNDYMNYQNYNDDYDD